MASITLEGNLPAEMPLREDGTQYPFRAALDDLVILADTRTEVIGHLIEGYAELPEGEAGDEEALFARYNSAVAIANMQQGVLAAEAAEQGIFDPATEQQVTFDPQNESEDVLTALFTPRDEKLDEFAEWTHPVPLVLVASGYAPYTATVRPTGNVQWIDPYTETTYLDGLVGAGLLELYVDAS
jgi:hypothetical protein